ncbi:MAG TPA: hypothetical protein VKB71_12950 [Rhizomicrobium sp.]|nr:hypothetical protein [Rhizomicrobium sp.]
MERIPIENDSVREPAAQAGGRDLLGQFCFYLHFAVMLFIVLGALLPWRAALVFYLVFIPGVFLQWQVNKDSCILNNTETWLRTGRWRNKEANPEEGVWVLTLARNVTGIAFSEAQINVLIYGVLVLGWFLALARLVWRI